MIDSSSYEVVLIAFFFFLQVQKRRIYEETQKQNLVEVWKINASQIFVQFDAII